LLGSGGSAQVFRGSWRNQEVAIKKISGVAHMEELTNEINARISLKHPRLVRFVGTCIEPNNLMVVTEFMSGGSLHDRLFGQPARWPALNPMQRWTVAMHTVEGLVFLHSQKVVHRDMKTMNILLDGNSNAKICDFGLTQQMDNGTHISRQAQGEGGSPRYMAPECYEAAHGKLTEKVDIWAMGCILIEIFAGTVAYEGCDNIAQLSTRILVQRRPPDVPASVPPPLADVFRRCLVFDPRRRVTAVDLHAELNRHRPNSTAGAAPQGGGQQIQFQFR